MPYLNSEFIRGILRQLNIEMASPRQLSKKQLAERSIPNVCIRKEDTNH